MTEDLQLERLPLTLKEGSRSQACWARRRSCIWILTEEIHAKCSERKTAIVVKFPMEGDFVIHVSKSQIDQIQYLIHQSIQGNHVLFDLDTLRQVLHAPADPMILKPLSEEESYSVEHHIERLLELPSLGQKRAYLERLDPRTYAWVVKTYFTIIENNLYETQEGLH